MKLPRGRIVKREYLLPFLRIACRKDCSLILVIFDADDDCPAELATEFREWLEESNLPAICEIVVIAREYEAWFLASLEALRGHRGISKTAVSVSNPELVRGAKERIASLMPKKAPYIETSDQPALTAFLDIRRVSATCRSFARLVEKIRDHQLAICTE